MSRPVGGVLSTGPLRGSGWVAIHLCGPPGSVDGRDALSTLGLAPDGVCRAARVAPDAGALLPHRFTLTCAPDSEVGAIGGLFSVALSCGSPRLAASQHPSLRSPDLPQRHPVGAVPRPPGRLTVVHSLLGRSAGWQRGIGFRRIDGRGLLAATGYPAGSDLPESRVDCADWGLHRTAGRTSTTPIMETHSSASAAARTPAADTGRESRRDASLAWQDRGACRGLDAVIFYPDPEDEVGTERALAVCSGCQVSEACLEHALTWREHTGIWGGATERDRRRILRRRRRSA